MAKTPKSPKKSSASKIATTVTRITANDSPILKTPSKKKVVSKKATEAKNHSKFIRLLLSIGGYFKGAWFELRQVRWPNRRATWGLTLAVLLFTVFFILLVVLLDILFKYLFQIILG
jgi:preprotein translocase SecE subunit